MMRAAKLLQLNRGVIVFGGSSKSSKQGALAACLLGLLMVSAGSGCSGLWYRIDRSQLDRIPNDEKLDLFDAENEVIIAKDNIEAVERNIADGRRLVEKARKKVELLKDNVEVAGISSPDVLALYREWAEARLAMREDTMRHLYLKRKASDSQLWLARARYELAKAQLVHDHDPERGASVNIKDFEKQVADREKTVADFMQQIDQSKARLEELRIRYDDVSKRLQEASGGAFGGPWVE